MLPCFGTCHRLQSVILQAKLFLNIFGIHCNFPPCISCRQLLCMFYTRANVCWNRKTNFQLTRYYSKCWWLKRQQRLIFPPSLSWGLRITLALFQQICSEKQNPCECTLTHKKLHTHIICTVKLVLLWMNVKCKMLTDSWQLVTWDILCHWLYYVSESISHCLHPLFW